MVRIPLAIACAVLVAAGPAQAAQPVVPEPVYMSTALAGAPPLPAGLASWLGGVAATDASMAVSLGIQTLGDVDLDGHADVLVTETGNSASASATSVLRALAGPDLVRVLWEATAEGYAHTVPDVDGDGIPEVLALVPSVSATGEAQGIGEANVETMDARGSLAFTVLAGSSGAAISQLDVPVLMQRQAAGGQLAGMARSTAAWGSLDAAGAGTLATLKQTVSKAHAGSGLPLPTPGSATQAEVDATLELLGLDGTVKSSVELSDPASDPWALIPVDLTGMGTSALALVVQDVSQVQEYPLVDPKVELHADGALKWSASFATLHGEAWLTPHMADLDADGTVDVAYSEVRQGATGAVGQVVALSGKDGASLAHATAEGKALGALGFDTGLLLVAFDLETGDLEVSAAGADLKAKWTVALPQGAFPLNALYDPVSGHLSGFTDVGGDLVADLVVAVPRDGGLTVQVHDGLDGALAWTSLAGAGQDGGAMQGGGVEAAADVDGLDVLGDSVAAALLAVPDGAASQATGLAGGAASVSANAQVATLRVAGAEPLGQGMLQATGLQGVQLVLQDAAQGVGLWRLPLAAPEVLAGLPKDAMVHASLEGVGDVDGDGFEDVAVRVAFHGPVDVSAEGHAHQAEATVHTRVVSGSSGETLFSHAQQGSLAVPLDAAPQVVPLAGYAPAGEAALNKSPMGYAVPLLATLAVLGAIAARRRK